MEKPMDNWNDDRLDELSRRMDGGFKQLNERFDRLLHALTIAGIGFAITVVGSVVGFIVTQA